MIFSTQTVTIIPLMISAVEMVYSLAGFGLGVATSVDEGHEFRSEGFVGFHMLLVHVVPARFQRKGFGLRQQTGQHPVFVG